MALRDWWDELARLVLPVVCPGCGRDDEAWCDACSALLAGPAWRCEDRAGRLDLMGGAPTLPVWTLADYQGPVREAVVAWKDRGRHDLTRPIAAALRRAGHDVAPGLGATSVLVVAAPSTPAAVRRRGGSLVGELAAPVAAGLTGAGVRATAAAALVRRGGGQVGLGARDRWLNVAGQVRLRPRMRAVVDGRHVLLLDDVLTTGATLASCRAALEGAGASVVAALTIASTPPPGRRGGLSRIALTDAALQASTERATVGTLPRHWV